MMAWNFRSFGGIALIVAGIVALPVPIVPGIPLIAAGAALLGNKHPMVRSCRAWLRKRGFVKTERKQDELSNVQD